jgi:hypothetical protein
MVQGTGLERLSLLEPRREAKAPWGTLAEASRVAEVRQRVRGQEEQEAGGADGPTVELTWEVTGEAGAVAMEATVTGMEVMEAGAEVTTSSWSQRQQLYIYVFFFLLSN